MTKVCSVCGKTKMQTAFHKNARAKDGLMSRCKECQRDAMQRLRERKEATRVADRSHGPGTLFSREDMDG